MMASPRDFRPSIQNPTHRSRDASPRRSACPRGLRGQLPLRPVGHVGARPAGAAHDAVDAKRQPEGKGQHAHAVEASKGQRKHHKGAA